MGIPVPTSDMQWDNCLLLFVSQVKRHRKRENQHIHSLAKPSSPDPKTHLSRYLCGVCITMKTSSHTDMKIVLGTSSVIVCPSRPSDFGNEWMSIVGKFTLKGSNWIVKLICSVVTLNPNITEFHDPTITPRCYLYSLADDTQSKDTQTTYDFMQMIWWLIFLRANRFIWDVWNTSCLARNH